MRSVAQQLALAKIRLQSLGDNPRLEAELLLCKTLDWVRTSLYTRAEYLLSDTEIIRYQGLVAQRGSGLPIAYLTGRQEFWSLQLAVTDAVLIPRADTECLVETALGFIRSRLVAEQLADSHADAPAASPVDSTGDSTTLKILELGTGSGAISLALASEHPELHYTACELSPDALAVAKNNALTLQIDSVQFLLSNWFSELADGSATQVQTQYDFILSNPPYIACSDAHLNDIGIKFEPRLALVSGTDGLNAIRHITLQAGDYLRPGGRLMLEHGHNQGHSVRELMCDTGYTQVESIKDAGQNERVTHGFLAHHQPLKMDGNEWQ